MHTSDVTALVVIAVFMVVFGGFVSWRMARRGDRQQVLQFLVGIPGVYLCAWASLDRVGWLYIPGLMLIAAANVSQFLLWHRSRRTAAQDSNRAGDQ